ncbi:hypothetical protein JOM56_000786 [Amanita muscaria]
MTVTVNPPPLDESLYSLDEEELAFFKSQTGIDDEAELKEHVLAIQAKAYKVFPYPCIRRFMFTKLRVLRSPFFERSLQLAKDRKDAIFVDAGCNFGHDLRKVVSAGWPVENTVAFDLEQAFWDYGHELFRSTPEIFSAAFVAGDVFAPSMIVPRAPFYEEPRTPRPNLRSLTTSLTPLQGFVTAVHASAFFHLFDEKQQLQAARQLATLLSPVPGSIIFGLHGGLPVKGIKATRFYDKNMFCHSPESWKELWDGQVFAKGTVRVEVVLRESQHFGDATTGEKFFFLVWCVTRL